MTFTIDGQPATPSEDDNAAAPSIGAAATTKSSGIAQLAAASVKPDPDYWRVKRSWVRTIVFCAISPVVYPMYLFYTTRKLLDRELDAKSSVGWQAACLQLPLLNVLPLYWLYRDLAKARSHTNLSAGMQPVLIAGLASLFLSTVVAAYAYLGLAYSFLLSPWGWVASLDQISGLTILSALFAPWLWMFGLFGTENFFGDSYLPVWLTAAAAVAGIVGVLVAVITNKLLNQYADQASFERAEPRRFSLPENLAIPGTILWIIVASSLTWSAAMIILTSGYSMEPPDESRNNAAVTDSLNKQTKDENANNATDTKDTDNDGLLEYEEKIYQTDPNKADTDNDGHSDKDEVYGGYNPNGPGELPQQ